MCSRRGRRGGRMMVMVVAHVMMVTVIVLMCMVYRGYGRRERPVRSADAVGSAARA